MAKNRLWNEQERFAYEDGKAAARTNKPIVEAPSYLTPKEREAFRNGWSDETRLASATQGQD